MPHDIKKDFPHVVRLYHHRKCDYDMFVGSGLLIGLQHVLTCDHVVEELGKSSQTWYAVDINGTKIKVRNSRSLTRPKRATDVEPIDLAVLTLEPNDVDGRVRKPNDQPAIILKKLTKEFLDAIEMDAIGGSGIGREPAGKLLRRPTSDAHGTLIDFQVAGGIKKGYSGSPVMTHDGKQWVCVGIARMGGEAAGNSRIITGDAVYRFLEKNHQERSGNPGFRFVDVSDTPPVADAAACEAVLRDYSEACEANWVKEKKQERLDRFVEPRLAIRTDLKIVDSSERKNAEGAAKGYESLLTDKEKEKPGDVMAVEQYRRLFERRPERPGKCARLCVTEDAGSGKSVFTLHLRAVLCSTAGQTAIFDGQPGLVVRWDGRGTSWPFDLRNALEQEVEKFCQKHDVTPQQAVDYALDHRRVCLILDALDQVSDLVRKQDRIKKREVLNSVFQFLEREEGQRCHVVMTGRSYAVTQGGEVHRFDTDAWVFATLESFDEGQQRRYLSRILNGRSLEEFIPSYREVAELMSVPVILNLIADITVGIAKANRIPLSKVCLDQFKTRGDLYRKAHEKLADLATKNKIQTDSTARSRWEAILSASAFAMMCDENQRRNYVVVGRHAVDDFQAQASKWGRNVSGKPLEVTEKDWKRLTIFSQLTNHVSVEECDETTVSWKHRGWMEYFAGLYLARYASPEAAAHVSMFSNDPDWYWVWRFAIETPDKSPAKIANPSVRTAVLANLFRRPSSSSGRRPNELIYRAWGVMESTESGKQILETFQTEFRELVRQCHPLAMQVEASFQPCPPDPENDSLTFLMGAPVSDAEAFENEKPQVTMTVEPFLLSNAPTTKGQYWLYDPDHRDDPAFADRLLKYSPTDNCPVIYVTWYDAWCYARWCDSRLSTEVEWEYACRAGTESRYWWGDKIMKSKCTFGTDVTTPASKKHANPWGLMEMSGNVEEWCDTWYVNELAQLLELLETGDIRILRGGSFGDFHPRWVRSSNRVRNSPGSRSDVIGFRISRNRIDF